MTVIDTRFTSEETSLNIFSRAGNDNTEVSLGSVHFVAATL